MTSKTYNNSQEPGGSTAEEKIASEEGQPSEALEPSPDPLAHLQAELEAAKVECNDWRDWDDHCSGRDLYTDANGCI